MPRSPWLAFAIAIALAAPGCARLNRIDPADPSLQSGAAPAASSAGASSLRLVTYNVHMESGRAIAAVIAARAELRRADVVFLQEIEDRGESEARVAAAALGMSFAYAPGYGLPRGGSHGVAILSRYPLADLEIIELPRYFVGVNSARRVALGATIEVAGEPIRLYSVHLDNRIDPDDRRAQLAPVLAAAADWPRVVIAGDLNTSPFCWTAYLVPTPCGAQADILERAARAHGFATPVTDSGATSKWLNMRLDAVYTRGVDVRDYAVDRGARLSDHLPLWADLAVTSEPG